MVYVFLADGFEEIEALTVVDILRRADICVKTVGIGSKVVKGTHNIEVSADILDSEISYDNDVEMCVLPGGLPGMTNLDNSKCVENLIINANSNNKFVAAICASPSVLGHKGLLKGKKACCYPGFEEQLFGANVVNERVVVDGNIITGCGAGASGEFAFKLVEVLKGKKLADEIFESMLCK